MLRISSVNLTGQKTIVMEIKQTVEYYLNKLESLYDFDISDVIAKIRMEVETKENKASLVFVDPIKCQLHKLMEGLCVSGNELISDACILMFLRAFTDANEIDIEAYSNEILARRSEATGSHPDIIKILRDGSL